MKWMCGLTFAASAHTCREQAGISAGVRGALGALEPLAVNPELLHVECDRQLRAAGRGPIRRSVWPVVSRTRCGNSYGGLIKRCNPRRANDRRLLVEFSRFIDADMHNNVVSVARGVIWFRIRRCLRLRS